MMFVRVDTTNKATARNFISDKLKVNIICSYQFFRKKYNKNGDDIIIIICTIVSYHRPFLPATSLETAVIPSAQASSFTLQYFPYYYYYYYYYYY